MSQAGGYADMVCIKIPVNSRNRNAMGKICRNQVSMGKI